MVLFPTQWLFNLMQFVKIPFSFRLMIIVMAAMNLALSLVCEAYVFPVISRWIGEWMNGRKAQRDAAVRQQQQIFSPPTHHSIVAAGGGGYGSQDMTVPAGLAFGGQSPSAGAGVGGAEGSVVATTMNVKKTSGKKETVKIYKIVEEEMMRP